MGVERPNVVLYTLGGPRGSSGLEDPPFVSLPPFHLPPTPVPPLSPLPSPPIPSFAVLLGIESLRLGFLVPLFPTLLPFGSPEAKNLPVFSPSPSPSPCARSWGRRRRAGRRVDEGGRGRESYFFSRAPRRRVDDFCDDFAWKINTHPRQAGRQANQPLSAISLPKHRMIFPQIYRNKYLVLQFSNISRAGKNDRRIF